MSDTALNIFDGTLQKTHLWLREIRDELGYGDEHLAYNALRAALHALRDRLTLDEAVQLGAQLPLLVRGIYYDGWTPRGKPEKMHVELFLERIREGFRGEDAPDPQKIARAVFKVLSRRVSEGEVREVVDVLPKDLRQLLTG